MPSPPWPCHVKHQQLAFNQVPWRGGVCLSVWEGGGTLSLMSLSLWLSPTEVLVASFSLILALFVFLALSECHKSKPPHSISLIHIIQLSFGEEVGEGHESVFQKDSSDKRGILAVSLVCFFFFHKSCDILGKWRRRNSGLTLFWINEPTTVAHNLFHVHLCGCVCVCLNAVNSGTDRTCCCHATCRVVDVCFLLSRYFPRNLLSFRKSTRSY